MHVTKPKLSWLEDPTVFAVNRLAAHSDHEFYSAKTGKNSLKQSLNGTWRVHLEPDIVHISFQGVATAFYVWLNGHFIGYSEDSFTPSDFDLTPYLVEGQNHLAVEVFKYSSASWIEDQDFWRLNGIFRDVFLYALPKAHLADIHVTANLASDYETGIHGVLNFQIYIHLN